MPGLNPSRVAVIIPCYNEAATKLVHRLCAEGLDMVVGARVSEEQAAYRFGHRFGNVLLTSFAATLFGRTFTDMLSGYRIFSLRYAKSFPAHSSGFEIKTELAVRALEQRMPVAAQETVYYSRPTGSQSKLNTYRDGWRILMTILLDAVTHGHLEMKRLAYMSLPAPLAPPAATAQASATPPSEPVGVP